MVWIEVKSLVALQPGFFIKPIVQIYVGELTLTYDFVQGVMLHPCELSLVFAAKRSLFIVGFS